jgi:hypothetical protein
MAFGMKADEIKRMPDDEIWEGFLVQDWTEENIGFILEYGKPRGRGVEMLETDIVHCEEMETGPHNKDFKGHNCSVISCKKKDTGALSCGRFREKKFGTYAVKNIEIGEYPIQASDLASGGKDGDEKDPRIKALEILTGRMN